MTIPVPFSLNSFIAAIFPAHRFFPYPPPTLLYYISYQVAHDSTFPLLSSENSCLPRVLYATIFLSSAAGGLRGLDQIKLCRPSAPGMKVGSKSLLSPPDLVAFAFSRHDRGERLAPPILNKGNPPPSFLHLRLLFPFFMTQATVLLPAPPPCELSLSFPLPRSKKSSLVSPAPE